MVMAAGAVEPVRITRDHADEMLPVWDPAGETIVYRTNREPGRVPAIASVSADGSKERLVATGRQEGFGICSGSKLAWVGKSGKVVTGETSQFHEFLEFKPEPERLTREVLDGDDDHFSVKLVIDGGGGSGLFDISRDGQVALWRHSSIGGNGTVSLRLAPYPDLTGGKTSETGALLVRRENTREKDAAFMDGSLGPKGEFVITSEASGAGYDLFLYEVKAPGKRTQLTTKGREKGWHFRQPVISPDGKKIVCAMRSPIGETRQGRIYPASWDLALLEIGEQKLTALTATQLLSENSPSWSPDGTRIVFSRRDTTEAGTVEPAEPDNANLYLLKIE